ncbi:UDP-N-acetylmuramate--L-alanine ligase [bacterium]|jgi:UDP-N-acetylmuramate--alanine ligase|nr:UDP-N-acetylmuramate--L-alanine ligase [bacterium]MBT3729981.1 UDP-N-acetylmuramate--L-alanine ligase [bacterium]MBT4894669.1 UDP-N-acetylmuramate--L-alanine ligase [bacterium]
MNIDKIKKVHFIGIGGIGVSAIARMFLARGVEVSGSDTEESEITKELTDMGAQISYGHRAENLADNTDLVVYTIAIDKDNPEFLKAKELGIEARTYSQMLGIISEGYYTVAVSGTHGKTTTTAMFAKVAVSGDLDPTVIVGSLLKDSGSNLVIGGSDLFIVEACEYKRSFLDLKPNILVITNIEEDHLDYYKDLADIQSAFRELVDKMGESDFVVCNLNDEKVKPVIENTKCKIIDYAKVEDIKDLKVTGEYNQQNAKAAFAVAEILKVENEKIISALIGFEGVWRRFEYKGKTESGAEVYDDYAHHPTEIQAVLKAARAKFPDQKIITVFQPHLYSRTKLLFGDISESFVDTDQVLVTPIYAAREENDSSINSEILADEINKNGSSAQAFKDFDEIKQYLKDNTQKDDIILTMGAGDVFKIGEDLINNKNE